MVTVFIPAILLCFKRSDTCYCGLDSKACKLIIILTYYETTLHACQMTSFQHVLLSVWNLVSVECTRSDFCSEFQTTHHLSGPTPQSALLHHLHHRRRSRFLSSSSSTIRSRKKPRRLSPPPPPLCSVFLTRRKPPQTHQSGRCWISLNIICSQGGTNSS